MERIQVVSIPALPPPVKIDPPSPPTLGLPPVLVTTFDEVSYWTEACEAFSDVDSRDQAALAEVTEEFPGLTRGDACDWAIYGFTVQGWLTFEAYMAEIASYIEQLRAHIKFQSQLMDERQKIISTRDEALGKLGSTQETTSYE